MIYFRVIETITFLTTRLLDPEEEDTNEKLRQPILVSAISIAYSP